MIMAMAMTDHDQDNGYDDGYMVMTMAMTVIMMTGSTSTGPDVALLGR